jgi:hypothetical protein
MWKRRLAFSSSIRPLAKELINYSTRVIRHTLFKWFGKYPWQMDEPLAITLKSRFLLIHFWKQNKIPVDHWFMRRFEFLLSNPQFKRFIWKFHQSRSFREEYLTPSYEAVDQFPWIFGPPVYFVHHASSVWIIYENVVTWYIQKVNDKCMVLYMQLVIRRKIRERKSNDVWDRFLAHRLCDTKNLPHLILSFLHW